jgi:hypothetical protein
MKVKATKWIVFATILIGMLMLNGCKFEEIVQPTTATAGDQITVAVSISTSDSDANAKFGLFGLMVPDDWTVDSVTYGGDFGNGTTHFLPPDSADGYPSSLDYGWVDSIEAHFPSGDLMHWEVYESDLSYNWETKSYIDATILMTVGNTNGTYGLGYFFTEGSLDFTDPSYYIDSLGNDITVTGGTAIGNEIKVLNKFNLSQNYPNPFNPTTHISYSIAEKALVNLTVYDLFGSEIAKLVNEEKGPGNYDISFSGENLPSGIYFYKLQAGKMIETRKMVLTK